MRKRGLSSWFCPSVIVVVIVIVVCHQNFENFITLNLETITTSKQEVTVLIPYLSHSDQSACSIRGI